MVATGRRDEWDEDAKVLVPMDTRGAKDRGVDGVGVWDRDVRAEDDQRV